MTERRRLQFRLRTILLLVLLFAVPLSWLAHRRAQMRTHQDAILHLEKLGGSVTSSCRSQSILQQALSPFSAWDVKVSFRDRSEFGDQDVTHLKHLVGLRSLDLRHTLITDVGLESLSDFSEIEELILNGTHIGDRGAMHLVGLSSLKILSLSDTSLTDTGLEHLEGLTNLTILCLADTHISEAGLMKIRHEFPDTKVDLLGYPMEDRVAGRRRLVEDQLGVLASALNAYESDCGDYPAESQGLSALFAPPNASVKVDWDGPYVKETPFPPFLGLVVVGQILPENSQIESGLLDPWGKHYRYRYGEAEGSPRLWSVGPDGVDATGDDIVFSVE